MVKPRPGVTVQFRWNDVLHTAIAAKDGFFRFEWQPGQLLVPGEYEVTVSLVANPWIQATSKIIIPHVNRFAFISDIDDTFLISHSGKLHKRLFVLLTQNAHSRNSFESVVKHYQLLASAGAKAETSNPFFYVSSSEWNLYDYIRDFSAKEGMPAGVYLLNQLKQFSQVFKTGQNNHKTKFMRIARVLEAYPEQRFVLLGDDSQEDPNIYTSVHEHFRGQVFCIYIRCVGKLKKPFVDEMLLLAGMPYCYFMHSEEAIAHSAAVGLLAV